MLAAGNMDALVGISDLELVQHIYGLVQRVEEIDLADEFYIGLTEAFERFAPSAERADLESRHADDPNRDREIDDSLRAFDRRAMLRLLRGRVQGMVSDAG